MLDLPMREADVAIRMKEPSQADLIRKRLMIIRMRLYASEKYLAERGALDEIDRSRNHRLICQSPSSHQVTAGLSLVQHLMSHDIPSLLTVNNYFGVLQAVLNDLGVGVLPDYVVEDFPDLVRVPAGSGIRRGARLPRLPGGTAPVAPHRRLPRLRAGRDHRPPPPHAGRGRRSVGGGAAHRWAELT